MKIYEYLFIAAAAMAFAACSNDEDGVNGPTPIRLSSSLTVLESRAGTDIQTSQFLTDENVDVFISEDVADGVEATTIYDQPLVYTTGNNGALTPATQQYFPTSGNGVNIHAFYPSGAVTAFDDTAVPFTVKTDQSTDANYKASDLMYGAPQSNPVARTGNAVTLNFKHLLSKVTITLLPGDGNPSLDGAKVELLDAYLSTYFTPSTQAISEAWGTPGVITIMTTSGTEVSGSAVVIPQTLKQQFLRVTLKDGGVLLGKLDDGTTPVLTGGNEYKYDITVNLSALSISGSIEAWNVLADQSGNATLQ